jgi:hypothetical protein
LAASILAASMLSMALVGVAPSASAGDDTTKPLLVLPHKGSFLQGGTIGPMLPVEDYGLTSTYDIPMYVRWRALDESGICGYKVADVAADYRPRWRLIPFQSEPSYSWMDDDYVDQQGGGTFNVPGYDVRAYDCAGNYRTKYVSGGPIVWQDTGESYGYGELAITYSGTWGVSNCTCWSGGTAHRTSEEGASATFEVPSGPTALVMETAPDRGEFELWIDGQYRRTVNTYAVDKQHRTIVWAGKVKGPGVHTIRIVNVASAGHPRIDLDAVLTH